MSAVMKLLAQIFGLSFAVAVLVLVVVPWLMAGSGPAGDSPSAKVEAPAASASVATKIDPATGAPAATDIPAKPVLQQPSPPRQTLPYERAEDRRLGQSDTQAETPPAPARKPKTKRFFRIVVVDGGTLKAGKRTIQLADIEARGAKAECTDSHGNDWPCGARARTALQQFIRWRAVTCTLPAGGVSPRFSAHCRIGGTDLSQWMLSQGWARVGLGADKSLRDAQKKAKEKKRGIWGDPAAQAQMPDIPDPGPVQMDEIGGEGAYDQGQDSGPQTGQLDQ
jgi:endonuclease YncB( thermonuclease family)